MQIAFLTLLSSALFLSGTADRTLYGDQAMYALIAKTIAITGNWAHLSVNGESYSHKPPLFFWLCALAFRWFGISQLTASLVSGFFGVLDTLLIYLLCRSTLPGWRTAFTAALIHMTTPEVLHWGRGVRLETLLNFWVLVGLFAVYRSIQQPSFISLLGLAAGGGWISKGIQGLYPLAVGLIFWKKEGMLRSRLASVFSLGGLAFLSAGIGLSLWVEANGGTSLREGYLGREIAVNLSDSSRFLFGIPWVARTLLRSYWPWLPAAVAGLYLLARHFRGSMGGKMWLVYAIVVVLAVSLAERKGRYLFQLYPVLSVAVGVAASALWEQRPGLGRILLMLVFLSAVFWAWRYQKNLPVPTGTQDEIAVATRLDGGPTWITWSLQHGDPNRSNTLGFYARPLLRICKSRCKEEAARGSTVVARIEEAGSVSAELGAKVAYQNATLAVLRVL